MTRKGDYQKKKKMGDIYKHESEGNESFREFVYKYRKSKRSSII